MTPAVCSVDEFTSGYTWWSIFVKSDAALSEKRRSAAVKILELPRHGQN
jgi:hypothetical protein